MKKFKATHVENFIRIESDKYQLIIIDKKPIDWVSITFDIMNSRRNPEMMVSGRDLQQYHPKMREITLNPQHSYVEVGAGMGEFIHTVVREDPAQKPMIIDPVNYSLMLEMLEYAELFSVQEDTFKRLRMYQQRCRDVLNPHKVRLINCRLEEALAKQPELRESADVVIDHYAAHHYSFEKEQIQKLELQLLKPAGKLLH